MRHTKLERTIMVDPHLTGAQKEEFLRLYRLCLRSTKTPSLPKDTDHLVVEAHDLTMQELTGYFVYRLHDAKGQLIYVGQSTNLFVRLAQHRKQSSFGSQIERVTYERMATKRAMDAREQALINYYQPPHNTVGTYGPEGLGRFRAPVAESLPIGRELAAGGRIEPPKCTESLEPLGTE